MSLIFCENRYPLFGIGLHQASKGETSMSVQAVRKEVHNDPETLEISIDTKAKVNEGDYARGGKKPDRCGGEHAQGVGS